MDIIYPLAVLSPAHSAKKLFSVFFFFFCFNSFPYKCRITAAGKVALRPHGGVFPSPPSALAHAAQTDVDAPPIGGSHTAPSSLSLYPLPFFFCSLLPTSLPGVRGVERAANSRRSAHCGSRPDRRVTAPTRSLSLSLPSSIFPVRLFLFPFLHNQQNQHSNFQSEIHSTRRDRYL